MKKEVLDRLEASDSTSVSVHGMGLLISKQICSLHRGVMTAANKDGGFRVDFSFPKGAGE